MGREIRKVPAGWEHPRHDDNNTLSWLHLRIGQYHPMRDTAFAVAMREWIEEWEAWERGERPDYFDPESYHDGIEFWRYHGGPPDPEYYRPEWADEDRTHVQFYETVSEGTPLSPPMPSLEALAEWLTLNKDFWDHGPMTPEQAEAFCKTGWAPSGVLAGGRYMTGIEALTELTHDSEESTGGS